MIDSIYRIVVIVGAILKLIVFVVDMLPTILRPLRKSTVCPMTDAIRVLILKKECRELILKGRSIFHDMLQLEREYRNSDDSQRARIIDQFDILEQEFAAIEARVDQIEAQAIQLENRAARRQN